MKLFVWKNFSPDYSGGLAFAIAKDQQEAMRMIEEERGYEVLEWGELEVLPINVKVARSVNGGM